MDGRSIGITSLASALLESPDAVGFPIDRSAMTDLIKEKSLKDCIPPVSETSGINRLPRCSKHRNIPKGQIIECIETKDCSFL